MAYQTITFDESVFPGDKLLFKFSFYDLVYGFRPKESDLADSANNAPGISISVAKYNFLSGAIGESGTIEGVVTETITPSEIANGIKDAWSKTWGLLQVKGINISEVQKDKLSASDFKPGISTTVSLAAVAIILMILFIQFGSFNLGRR